MDTVIRIRLYGSTQAANVALDECNELLGILDDQLSATREQSLVAQFNASATGADIEFPQDLISLLNQALTVNTVCQGAFDITTAPLSALWKECESKNTLPDEAALASALSLVGSQHLSVHDGRLLKDEPNVRIDLGGIGKGYATDRLLACLTQHTELTGGIISFGSSVGVFGSKPDGTPFTIAIRNPNDISSTATTVLLTPGQVLSVSGDYERYFTINGQQYGHILDPVTGYPPDNGLRSVAVIASDGVTADALSTALMVMGENAGRALYDSQQFDFEVIFLYDDHIAATPGVPFYQFP